MRAFGPLKDGDSFRVPADTIGTAVITTAGFAVKGDWPTGRHTIRISSPVRAYYNPISSKASVPTTSLLVGSTASTSINIGICANQPESFYVPADSTGFAIAGETSGVITVEYWKQG